ncbi:MAG: methionyl-tRNA formyltransferase [Lachnospiraceae bacterium]|nr:methionyl-tRNA formyltransferase [Lachnospiraceae bacterium]
MKIIFMGTPDFATFILDELNNAGHDIVLVITQPDKPRGRSGKLSPSPVKKWATEHEVPVYQPAKIRDEESIEYLSKIDADIGVVAAFGQILPKKILDMPRFGCVNVHASLLPKYRGAAPIQWAILNGDKKTGVTIMQMGPGLDDGDILLSREVDLTGNETGGELFDTLAQLGAKSAVEALELIEGGKISPIKQDESLATHVGMINKSMGLIDWNKPAKEIERYVRGLNPWPTAYTSLKGKNLKIWQSHVVSDVEADAGKRDVAKSDNNKSDSNMSDQNKSNNKSDSNKSGEYKSGQVCHIDKKSLYIMTGDGILSLDEIQLEGKKRMAVSSFLLGNQLLLGEELG